MLSFRLYNYSCCLLFFHLISCSGQNNSENTNRIKETEKTFDSKIKATITDSNALNNLVIDKNIRSIFQDKKGNYWFGTNSMGVYCYDGKTVIHYTVQDGLSNNQIQSIQEDNSGNLWFGTGSFGVSRFDGEKFTTFTSKEYLKTSSNEDWKIKQSDHLFNAGGGVYRTNGSSLYFLPLAKDINSKKTQTSPFQLSQYGVYSILRDKKGNSWFGTQAQGVCKFDGKSFTWFTEKGLRGPAVLCLFEDSKGNIWFGNNGSGLFKYDGKTVTNFSDEKGLANKEFNVSGKSYQGTLARIYAINEDNSGNIWIGTVDTGVWKYDGNNVSNYTTKNGLTSNAVNFIYKDQKGQLWFGTDTDGICQFNGKSFTKFKII